jgi:hypothetical protein
MHQYRALPAPGLISQYPQAVLLLPLFFVAGWAPLLLLLLLLLLQECLGQGFC